ncbi:MAG: MBL fold metallo-hydrolase [Tetrasphaera sp.]|jgi:ribonuclease BN (tRNA processing enzyme)|nr:MBL fold metallo-hydrolase [Tetrasphaera sp.]
MRVTIVGCSGSFAGPASPASSYLVQADQDGRRWSVVFDLGNGALGSLQRHLDPSELDAIVLSHLHPDHCIDVTSLYVYRNYHPGGRHEPPLPVHCPPGTRARMLGAFEGLDPHALDGQFAFHDVTDGHVVQIGPLRVTARRVRHPVEAYGFRIESADAVLAYSGDSDSCPALVDLAAGADLALFDSAFMEGRDTDRGIHMTSRRAAEIAVEAGARRLMLTHMPAWNDQSVCRDQAAEVWPGEVELARPDAAYDLPS